MPDHTINSSLVTYRPLTIFSWNSSRTINSMLETLTLLIKPLIDHMCTGQIYH